MIDQIGFSDDKETTIYFDLYVAGTGFLIAMMVGVLSLIALYNPELLENGVQWMNGPWYARISAQILAFWISLGGILVGFSLTKTAVMNLKDRKDNA